MSQKYAPFAGIKIEIKIKETEKNDEEADTKGIVDVEKRIRLVIMAVISMVHACMAAADRWAHSCFAEEASTEMF